MPTKPGTTSRSAAGATAIVFVLLASAAAAAAQPASRASTTDPRVGLKAGNRDAGTAALHMQLLAERPRPTGFYNPESPGDGAFSNTDLAFRGDYAYVGNYNGFMIYDISEPTRPALRTSVVCPGGQGDLSVFGNLVFMSAQETRGRLDCGTAGVAEAVSGQRFRGVRIFDVSNMDTPRQVAAVQTCRGSHTHSLVTRPGDDANVYVYVSGTSVSRPAAELDGCSDERSPDDPNSPYWRIEVIRVPLAAPQQARIVSEPRVFADAATGSIAGLWRGGDHGAGTQSSRETAQCHDITTYPESGMAAGACSGNGILWDISDPANPRRLHEVVDANFAFWHSATFNNDGTKVIFTDEWGGGSNPRCRASDPLEWGANAIFDVVDGALHFRSYYKMPAAQTDTENCVAHNGSLVPVPGRDIKVQAWYQGGVSVFDFTDSSNPVEIAFFDRGPISDTELVSGGYWSTYWYNGHIYGVEIHRGFDVLSLTPSEHLSQNELDAARLVRYDEFNPQHQPRIVWPAAFPVARAYVDQLARGRSPIAERAGRLHAELTRAEQLAGAERRTLLDQIAGTAELLEHDARAAGGAVNAQDLRRTQELARVLRELAAQPR